MVTANMQDNDKAEVNQLVMDILEDKKKGCLLVITEKDLAFGGMMLTDGNGLDHWQVAIIAAYKIAEHVMDNGTEHFELIRKLVDDFLTERGLSHATSSSLFPNGEIEELAKLIKASPDKIDEIVGAFAKKTGLDIKMTKIELNKNKEQDK